jgi:hypothetical protein
MIYYKKDDLVKWLAQYGIGLPAVGELNYCMLCNLSSKSNGELITMWHTGPGNIIPYIYGYNGNQTIFPHQTLWTV